MGTSKSQDRRSLISEVFTLFSTIFLDGLKGSNRAGLEVVGSLLAAGVVVVTGGFLLVVGVVTSAVVLEGVT